MLVLPALHNAYCGIAQQSTWLVSTQQTGGTGRPYDPELFCRDDRMVWVTGLIEVRRGRKMEEWGMDALEEVFGVRYNDFGSTLKRSDIGQDCAAKYLLLHANLPVHRHRD